MGPIEWLVIGFSTVVGSLTMLTEPTDVLVDHISVPAVMEESGYTDETMGQILDDATSTLFRDAGLHYSEDYSFRLNYRGSGLAQLAEEVGLNGLVESLHTVIGLVDARITITFLSSDDGGLVAEIDTLEPITGRLLDSEQIVGDQKKIPELIDEVAKVLVRHIKPVAYALHQFALETPTGRRILAADPLPSGTYANTMSYVETWLVRNPLDGNSDDQLWTPEIRIYRADMFNLLGIVYLLENNTDAAAKSFMKSIEFGLTS